MDPFAIAYKKRLTDSSSCVALMIMMVVPTTILYNYLYVLSWHLAVPFVKVFFPSSPELSSWLVDSSLHTQPLAVHFGVFITDSKKNL